VAASLKLASELQFAGRGLKSRPGSLDTCDCRPASRGASSVRSSELQFAGRGLKSRAASFKLAPRSGERFRLPAVSLTQLNTAISITCRDPTLNRRNPPFNHSSRRTTKEINSLMAAGGNR